MLMSSEEIKEVSDQYDADTKEFNDKMRSIASVLGFTYHADDMGMLGEMTFNHKQHFLRFICAARIGKPGMIYYGNEGIRIKNGILVPKQFHVFIDFKKDPEKIAKELTKRFINKYKDSFDE